MDTESRVDSYSTPLDAELAKAYLESHGIAVRLEGDVIMGAAFALGPMLGGIQLYVDEANGEQAGLLLASYHRALREHSPAQPELPDQRVDRAWIAAFLGLVTIPIALHAYSVWLLLQIKSQTLSPKARKRYVVAWIVNSLAFIAAGWMLWKVFG